MFDADVRAALVHPVRRYRDDKSEGERRIAGQIRKVAMTPSGITEFADEGEGTAVLTSHGVCGGFHAGLWTGRHTLGDEGFRVIAPSRFGYLGTPMPDRPTPGSQADAFAALLDHLGVDRTIVVGYSAGATSAIRFAFRHPDRTIALISVSSNVPGPHLDRVKRIPRAVRPLAGSDLVWWAFRTFLRQRYLHFIGVPAGWKYSDADRAALDQIVPDLFPVSNRAEGVIFDTFVSNPSINRPFPDEPIEMPALLVHAKDDPLAPYPGAVRLADRLPGARLVSLQHGGHLQLGDAGAELRAAVLEFLAQVRSTSDPTTQPVVPQGPGRPARVGA